MEAESEPFEISSLKVDPEDTDISAPVKLSLGFTPTSEISDFQWKVSYMIDTVMKRQIIPLIQTELQTYPAGTKQ